MPSMRTLPRLPRMPRLRLTRPRWVAFAVAAALGSALVVPAGAQGSISSQVLRLLDRVNTWTAAQTYLNGMMVLDSATGAPAPTTNRLYNIGGILYWNGALVGSGGGGGGGTGTVTSVGLTLPGIFSVTGSPIVSAGSLDATLATQAANRVWAGPTTGAAAAPTFRAVVDADIPDTITIAGANNVTWASVNKTGSSLGDLTTRSASDLGSGTLAASRLFDNDATAGIPLVSGAGGDPSYSALDLASATATTGFLKPASFPVLTGDLTTSGGSLVTALSVSGVTPGTYASATVTVDAKGRVTSATSNSIGAHNLLSATHSDVTPSPVTRGGTIVGGPTTWICVIPSVTGSVLRYDGSDTSFSTDASALTSLNASNITAGTLAAARGGTGQATLATNGQLLIGNGTGYTLNTLTGTANRITVTGGVGTITLTTPQDLATASSVQFAKLGIGTGAGATAAVTLAGSMTGGYIDNGSSGAAKTIDWSAGDFQTLTLTANTTLTEINAVAGQRLTLRLVQDGTGSRLVTWWTTIKWAGGVAPTLTTTVSKADVVTCWATTSTTFDCSVSQNY